MFELTHFTLRDMTECGATLRKLGAGADSMEEVANRIVQYFYDNLGDHTTDQKACVLVRFFITCEYERLTTELRQFAQTMLGRPPESPAMKCLTLVATAGARPEWNRRAASAGHQAIPLPSEEMVTQVPMISNLIKQFGLDVKDILHANSALLIDMSQRTFNVFYVPEALGSPYVPAQEEFVVPLGVRSVLGFGGMLPPQNLFAVILFSRVPIPRETADMFQTLALSVRLAVLPFSGDDLFS